MDRARRIDTHQHYVPPRYAEVLRGKGIRPGGVDVPGWSAERALRFMDHHGIGAAVLSLSTPGVWFGDAGEARRWAREVNEYAAEVVSARPDRFGFFATLTLPDVEGALDEADYALGPLGADGVVLLASNDGRYLGDPAFAPLLDELDRRGSAVFVHPGELPGPGAVGIPAFTADFLLDTTRTAVSLILSGAMERYRRLAVILAHAGGFVPYIAARIVLTMLNAEPRAEQLWALVSEHHGIPVHLEVLRRFYYDLALSASASALPSLLAVADGDRILYGSDYPFAPAAAVGLINREYERYPLDERLREAIDSRTAAALFPRLAGAV